MKGKIRNIRMMNKRFRPTAVSATEAAKNFGELVDRVREAGCAYVVERKGKPIAEIAPVGRKRCTFLELVEWAEAVRPAPSEFGEAVKAHVKAVNRPAAPASRWRS
jgi:prevent-host-death family protein